MPLVKELSRSFAGGEITPEMYGRLDNVKYQTGLALCRNAVVLPHGPVTKRPGFTRIPAANAISDSAYGYAPRLIPFAFSATQTMVVAIYRGGFMRFYSQGAPLMNASTNITGITKANPGVVTSVGHGLSNGMIVYISGVSGMTQVNNRYFAINVLTANTFALYDDMFGYGVGGEINTTSYDTYTSGGTVTGVHQIASPYAESDLAALTFTQSNDVITITHPSYSPRELRRTLVAGNVVMVLATPTLGNALTLPGTPTVVATAGTGTAYNKNFYYKITTVSADGTEESLPTTASSATANDLTLSGSKNTVSWTTAGSGVTYRVYKAVNGVGRLYGFIAETSDLSFIDDNITPDYSRNPPAATIRLDTSGNYPSCVTYYEQRRMFAGTSTNPQTIYGTRSATESNLNTSVPSNAADALSFTIKAQQQNAIRHLVPMNDLIALTAGGVWKVGSTNNQALSPSTLSVRQQNGYGSSAVRPLITGNSTLYVEANGRRVRDMSFQWQSQVYTSDDRSIMAPHLFQSYTLTDAAYSRSPDQIAWFVRSDGVLLGMSYVPEQQVFGWHQHTTNGYVRSVCVVTENSEDTLYAVIERKKSADPNDYTMLHFIERMSTRFFSSQSTAYFVDNGVQYSAPSYLYIWGGTTLSVSTYPTEHGLVNGQTYYFDFTDTSLNGVGYVVTVTSSTTFTITTPTSGSSLGYLRRYVTTFSGLNWLAGKSVVALADGAVVAGLTVSAAGTVTLPARALDISLGLAYTTDIQTLPLSVQEVQAAGQGTMKSVDYAFLRVNRTGIVKVGPSSDRLTTIPPRTNENYDTPPRLRSEILDLLVNPDISQDAQLWIQSPDPTPLTVSALTMKVSLGG